MSEKNLQFKIQGMGMFGAAVIWGTWVLVLNGVTLPGFFVTAITSFTGFLGLFVYTLLSGKRKKLRAILKTPSLLKIISVIAILEALQNALFMAAFTLAIQDGGSVFIPIIRSLIGIITPIAAIVFIKKEFSYRYLFLGALSTIGAIIIFTWGGIISGDRISYLALGLVFTSVIISAIQNLAQRTMALRMIEAKQDESVVITYQTVLTSIFLIPLVTWYIFTNTEMNLSGGVVNQFLFIGLFGITHVALAFILRLNSLKHITAQQAVIIVYLEPVTSISLSILFLKESINPGFVIGSLLILTSAVSAGIYSSSAKNKN